MSKERKQTIMNKKALNKKMEYLCRVLLGLALALATMSVLEEIGLSEFLIGAYTMLVYNTVIASTNKERR